MHIGGLRTALFEYLTAKSKGGKFILRIEDTDQERFVEGASEVIYDVLKIAGLIYDEGPDVGGDYGPYIQSQRKDGYLKYAKKLVENKNAYYCFCSKEELNESENVKYDRRCLSLTEDEINKKLSDGVPYVIRQKIPEGKTTFHDEVFGDITIDNEELEDQILIKSDGLPTYNFANVIDDHLMEITHVVRGSEFLTSTPKYNLLYKAFGWDIPVYAHLPLVLNENGAKLSKRKGDATVDDLLNMGFLPEAIVNYIALLGWSPTDNKEIFNLDELIEAFDTKGLSKSPSTFDMKKLTWFNSEYIKKMPPQKFYDMVLPILKQAIIRSDVDLNMVSEMVKTRINFVKDAAGLVDFIDDLPDYDIELYVHKKMKTTKEIAKASLESVLPVLEQIEDWKNETLYAEAIKLVEQLGIKNGQMLWPIRTALSGKETSPCGATELAELLGCQHTNKIENQNSEGIINIVCTNFPQYDWVRHILGNKTDNVELTLLLNNGIDPHNYQPSIDDIIKISTCDLFIYVGGESDKWVDDVLKDAINTDMAVINLLDILGDAVKTEDIIEGMEKEGSEEEPEHDEHVWLSLKNTEAFCYIIVDELSSLDIDNAEEYKSNLASYISQIKTLDAQYQAVEEPMPQLICRDLTLGYEGKTIVSGLSFSVEAGDYICIIGENGSGKSTLMKTILKLKTPMSGQILTGEGLLQSDIGYLSQQTDVQKDFPASVQEVVFSGCLNRCGLRPFYNKQEEKIAVDIMEKLGIRSLAKICYRELSGGQQQRVLLARALCAAQKILLLDEPMAGLDPKATVEMYGIIKNLNNNGITIIMVSHDIAASIKYASHILFIGNPLFYGTKTEYLKSETGLKYTGLRDEQE
ncbi:glutamate--trna ligase [Holotrichia oblita]|nr:glutamate--trna ligase [Holotrichia oblita]